ncbi:MAG TPA: hypothetical protein VHZ25_00350 [Acidobacteriaceae bacterium]|jgi:tetratricopeptide (TPR) repeat protein|nr:hypothetical protein [Acidobacteriaceae bacterium]
MSWPRTRVRYVLLSLVLGLGASVAFPQEERNLLPKYGSLPKEEWQKEADAVFTFGMDKDYHGDRKKASEYMAARGWQYLRAGDPDDAMRRFNQPWLLNASNGTALWGMGAVEADAGKFDESLKLCAEAEPLVGKDINFSVDYARMLAMAGTQQKDGARLKEAFAHFEGVYKEAPLNILNLQNWANALFALGRYAEAWDKVKLAEATPGKRQLDPKFVEALQAKMPQPEK